MVNNDVNKFEFLLTLEKNIVIKRFFDVPNYNLESKNSVDLYECIKSVCKEIGDDLKDKTLDYLNENANYFFDSEGLNEPQENKEEYFLLQIKFNEKVFISRIFPAHIYHPKVRYAVDIRPKIRKILASITNVLSSKNLDYKYLQYDLK